MKPGCNCIEKLAGEDRIAVVHHWDADGVAAAAIVIRWLRERGRDAAWIDVPEIGRYSWQAVPTPPPGTTGLAVLDYGIPGGDYDRLAASMKTTRLYVLDHHRVEPPGGSLCYCNPVAYGTGGEEEYPSASFLAHQVLRRSGPGCSLLAALGAVGDLAPFYDSGRRHAGLAVAERLAREAGLQGLHELRELAESIDSCYRLLDRECLRYAVRQAVRDPYSLLGDKLLDDRRRRAESLLDQARERLREAGEACGADVYVLEMDALVTSAVGRWLAAQHPSRIVVLVHHIPSQGGGFIYARSLSKRLDWLHELARSQGLRAGGKTNVAVIEYEGSLGHGVELARRLLCSLGSSS